MTVTDIALAASEPNPENTGYRKRVSRRMSEFIRLIVTGECKTQRAACERTGLHPSSIAREMKKAHVRVFIERCARETIAAGTMRASARLVELLDAASEHVSLDASKHMLGIAGIKPANDSQVNVSVDIKAGYVIDISSDRPGDGAKVINARDIRTDKAE